MEYLKAIALRWLAVDSRKIQRVGAWHSFSSKSFYPCVISQNVISSMVSSMYSYFLYVISGHLRHVSQEGYSGEATSHFMTYTCKLLSEMSDTFYLSRLLHKSAKVQGEGIWIFSLDGGVSISYNRKRMCDEIFIDISVFENTVWNGPLSGHNNSKPSHIENSHPLYQNSQVSLVMALSRMSRASTTIAPWTQSF